MNTKEWKQKELNRLLMEKFNLSSPELEEEVEIDESHVQFRMHPLYVTAVARESDAQQGSDERGRR